MINLKKWAAVLIALTATLIVPRALRAQDSKAAAEALFDEGRRLMGESKYAEACEKFQKSQEIDPSVGTLLNLGDCLEKSKKVASAWGRYKEAGNLAAKLGDPRAKTAAERAAALQARVSTLTISVPAAAKVDGLQVSLDGAVVAASLLGVPSPVDAGNHVVSASAPGKKPWKTEVSLAESERKSVEVQALGPDDGTGTPTETPPAAAEGDKSSNPSEGGASAGGSVTSDSLKPKTKQRTYALIAGGVGVVGLGVGTFLALGAKSKYNDAKSHCKDGTSGCDSEAASLSSDAKSQATLATVGFGVGVAGLAAGAVLWFTTPKEKSAERARRRVAVAPILSPGVSGLLVQGVIP